MRATILLLAMALLHAGMTIFFVRLLGTRTLFSGDVETYGLMAGSPIVALLVTLGAKALSGSKSSQTVAFAMAAVGLVVWSVVMRWHTGMFGYGVLGGSSWLMWYAGMYVVVGLLLGRSRTIFS